jgi:hypothetical protein
MTIDTQRLAISSQRCDVCGVIAPTRHVRFRQNIGALVVRFSKSVDGNLCKDCIGRYFWSFTVVTLLFGWWGVISFFMTPFIILNNVLYYWGARRFFDVHTGPASTAGRETSDTQGWAPIMGGLLAMAGIAFGLWFYWVPSSGLLPATSPVQVPVGPVVAAAPTTMPVPPTSTPLAPAIPTAAPTARSEQVVAMVYVSAGGEGVYVRSRPAMDARVKAWPDGTPLGLIEYPLLGWALVRAPDGYVGYVPREYVVDKPPPVPTSTMRRNRPLT